MAKKCTHPDSKVKKFRTYEPGDFYLYHAECACGLKVGAWSQAECEKKLKKARDKAKGGRVKA